jgi:hypothetical protein
MNPQQNWNQNGNFPSNAYPNHGYGNGIPNGGIPNGGFPNNNFPAQPGWQAPWQNWHHQSWNAQNWNAQQPWQGFNPFMQLAQLMQQCAAICAQIGFNPAIFSTPGIPGIPGTPATHGTPSNQQPQGAWNQHGSNYNQNFNPQSNAPFPVPIDGSEKPASKRGALSRDAA